MQPHHQVGRHRNYCLLSPYHKNYQRLPRDQIIPKFLLWAPSLIVIFDINVKRCAVRTATKKGRGRHCGYCILKAFIYILMVLVVIAGFIYKKLNF